ncbi:uncharacterized protein LOC122027917 [Zingiber officinale]|uniref:uncharacterized protein LOC122027917 n=1 Tax=Zingiber officinale TaxID=94328 RepID=UPI001C4AED7A|nr:uncharacterized protein LOC122027917 [Zingiber officinale]
MGMLPAKSYPTLCHYPSSSPSLSKRQNPNPRSLLPHIPPLGAQSLFLLENSTPRLVFGMKPTTLPLEKRRLLHTCRDSIEREDFEASVEEKEKNLVERTADGGASASDWITSVLLFGLWAGLMYYVFQLAPNQTPYRDMYFLQKLFFLKGDDGFVMNRVLVAVWWMMGLWPLVYSMLLLPTGRSSRSKVPVWPFLVASFFVGAYALIPYFVLWKPPPPAVEEEELTNWPLNFLDSKVTAMITIIAGLGLIVYAGLADGAVWMEFYQYCRESKLIHVTVIDFLLCTAFAPFWVYNDMTARGWMNKGSWLLPIALIPLVGPALYVLLRPPLAALPMFTSSTSTKSD